MEHKCTFYTQTYRSVVIEVKFAVNGMAAYDNNLRLIRAIPRLGLCLNLKPIYQAVSLETGHTKKPMIQRHHQGQV